MNYLLKIVHVKGILAIEARNAIDNNQSLLKYFKLAKNVIYNQHATPFNFILKLYNFIYNNFKIGGQLLLIFGSKKLADSYI